MGGGPPPAGRWQILPSPEAPVRELRRESTRSRACSFAPPGPSTPTTRAPARWLYHDGCTLSPHTTAPFRWFSSARRPRRGDRHSRWRQNARPRRRGCRRHPSASRRDNRRPPHGGTRGEPERLRAKSLYSVLRCDCCGKPNGGPWRDGVAIRRTANSFVVLEPRSPLWPTPSIHLRLAAHAARPRANVAARALAMVPIRRSLPSSSPLVSPRNETPAFAGSTTRLRADGARAAIRRCKWLVRRCLQRGDEGGP